MITYDPNTKIRPSYRGKPLAWEGVIRDRNTVIWACGHEHHNRDASSQYNGISAMDCAKAEYLRTWT